MIEQRLYPLVPHSSADTVSLESASDPTASIDQVARRPPSLCASCRTAPEIIGLRQQAAYWKSNFERCKEREQRLRQELLELRATLHAEAQEREQVLQQQIAALTAQIRVLEERLRGQKSEKRKKHPETGPLEATTPKRRRGQQPDNPVPPRRSFDHLPTVHEPITLPAEQQCCPECRLPLQSFPGSDDGDIVEIEIRSHRRRYHRQRYRKTCTCPGTPGVITAPPPPKLIPKSYLGISVWVLLLLEKYIAYQPTYRFLTLLRSLGVDLPLGTVTAGLRKLLPLFEPLYQDLLEHQRQEHHWHCDETRWLVFVEQEGKKGHNWSLWVFRSPHAVVFVLDPTRAHHVVEEHLAGAQGIASVDRATVYKAMAQVKVGDIVLAFCWAHVRRDFLEVWTGYTELGDWAGSWLQEIRELYRRNDARVEALGLSTMNAGKSAPPVSGHHTATLHSSQAAAVTAQEQALRDHVAHLVERRDTELQQPDLMPACKKVLTSLQRHWSGLTVFLDHPEVPLDNNAAERAERGPVVGRKNYYGSGSIWSGRLAAIMFSLLQTLTLWHLCPLRWLTAYLTACATAGGKAPHAATAFLPWNLTAEQKQQWSVPSSQPAAGSANTS
jgi:transposase